MLRPSALTILAAGALLLAACRGDESDAPRERAADAPVRIVYIQKNVGNPYFDAINQGFEDAAAEFGFSFAAVGPATAEATSQIPFLRDQIQRRADVIAISPNSPDALNTLFDQARQRGSVVMMLNSDIPGFEQHRDLAILPMDFDLTGPSQIELLGSMIGYQGQFAILSSTTDAPDQNFWIQGMREALQDGKYAGMELVAVVYGDDEPQKSQTEAEALLTRFPDLRGIIAPTTVGIASAAQVVELAGVHPGGPNARNGGVVVTGLGNPNQMRRFVKEGIVEKFALWSPRDQGYLAGWLGQQIVEGAIDPAEGVEFSVPSLGDRGFRRHNVVITGPPTVFDASNIDDFDF